MIRLQQAARILLAVVAWRNLADARAGGQDDATFAVCGESGRCERMSSSTSPDVIRPARIPGTRLRPHDLVNVSKSEKNTATTAPRVGRLNGEHRDGRLVSTMGPSMVGYYALYPRGIGASNGPMPNGYVMVSRWVNAAEAKL